MAMRRLSKYEYVKCSKMVNIGGMICNSFEYDWELYNG